MPSDQFSGNHSPDWSHYSMLPTLTLTFSNQTKDLLVLSSFRFCLSELDHPVFLPSESEIGSWLSLITLLEKKFQVLI